MQLHNNLPLSRDHQPNTLFSYSIAYQLKMLYKLVNRLYFLITLSSVVLYHFSHSQTADFTELT